MHPQWVAASSGRRVYIQHTLLHLDVQTLSRRTRSLSRSSRFKISALVSLGLISDLTGTRCRDGPSKTHTLPLVVMGPEVGGPRQTCPSFGCPQIPHRYVRGLQCTNACSQLLLQKQDAADPCEARFHVLAVYRICPRAFMLLMKYSDPSSASTPSMPAGCDCECLCGGERSGRQLALRTRIRVSQQKTIDSRGDKLSPTRGASDSAGGFKPLDAEERLRPPGRSSTADSPPGTTKACALVAAGTAATFCIRSKVYKLPHLNVWLVTT